MKCLHEEPCAQSTTQKGSFWYCNQNPSSNFFCSEDESYLYEKAITAWKCTEQAQPRCEKHSKWAKMRIVKDLMKANYGRPFFVCSDKSKPCSFWVWGDEKPIAKPECRHGFPCVIRKVKKEGINRSILLLLSARKLVLLLWMGARKRTLWTLKLHEIKTRSNRKKQISCQWFHQRFFQKL
mgnify:CR=1 FL=1